MTVQSLNGPSRMLNPAEACDLRRRRRRDLVERLVDRAQWLPAEDRTLVESVYQDGRTVSDLASLLGANPRTLRRRLRRLTRRLLSPQFVFVVAHRDRWPSTRRRVAEACVLHGRSLRETARELRLSLHCVRRHHDAVTALFQDACT